MLSNPAPWLDIAHVFILVPYFRRIFVRTNLFDGMAKQEIGSHICLRQSFSIYRNKMKIGKKSELKILTIFNYANLSNYGTLIYGTSIPLLMLFDNPSILSLVLTQVLGLDFSLMERK